MRWWLTLLVACGTPAPSHAPAAPPSPAPLPVPRADAGTIDAPAPRVSTDLGPELDRLADIQRVPQDHELTLTTATQRITLRDGDPAHAEVAPVDTPALGMTSRDGTWSVHVDARRGVILAEPGNVEIHRAGPLVRFLGGVEGQRTVVLDRSVWGWFVVRSGDSGKTWKETRLQVAGSTIASSRRSLDLVTQDADWVRIDDEGDVTTIPIARVVPDSYACAARTLWLPHGDQLLWFDTKAHGKVAAKAHGYMTCAGDDALVPVEGGVTRCTHSGCGPVLHRGDHADLMAEGVVSATQLDLAVHVERTGRASVDVPLADGERLAGLAVWSDVPTLVVVGASRRLHLVAIP